MLAVTNPKGLNALHMACAVRPGKPGLHEENGIKTVTALLDAGIDIESVAFRDNDGGEWRANAVWFAVQWTESSAATVLAETRRRSELLNCFRCCGDTSRSSHANWSSTSLA